MNQNEPENTEHEDPAANLPSPGKYRGLKASSWAWETSKDGNVYLQLLLLLEVVMVEGEEPKTFHVRGRLNFQDTVDARGKTVFQKSFEALRSLGLKGTDLSVIGENEGPLGEGTVDIELEHETWEKDGEQRVGLAAKCNNPSGMHTLTSRNAPDGAKFNNFTRQMAARMNQIESKANASGTQPVGRSAPPAAPRQASQPAPVQPRTAGAAPVQPRQQQGFAAPRQQSAPPRGQTMQRPAVQGGGGGEFDAPQGGDDDIPFDGAAGA